MRADLDKSSTIELCDELVVQTERLLKLGKKADSQTLAELKAGIKKIQQAIREKNLQSRLSTTD